VLVSLDCEATGLDLAHGAAPFLVTWCEEGSGPCYCEWPVDPMTRQVTPDDGDIAYIIELLDAASVIYMHNGKFDARALQKVGIELPWAKVSDTMIMAHLLATNFKRDLTFTCRLYLDIDIQPYEDEIERVTKAARAMAKRHCPQWRIAREGGEGMPSVSESSKRDEDKPWKNDMWLPAAMMAYAPHLVPPVDATSWLNACKVYACSDSEHTLHLGIEMESIVCEKGLGAIYEHRMKLPKVDCEMECYGVTVIGEYVDNTIRSHTEYVAEAAAELEAIATSYGHKLELASGASLNDNMRDFFYGSHHKICPRCGYDKRIKHWNMEVCSLVNCPKCGEGNTRRAPVVQALVSEQRDNLGLHVVRSDNGNATLDKGAIQEYLTTLEGTPLDFIRILADKRKHNTDLGYMEMYQRFCVPMDGMPGFYKIYASINPCGSDHLRQSSNSPNLQNVGGQEDICEECDGAGCDSCNGTGKSRVSLKNCFGPAPGREWWSMDYKSIEARIPAYESGEPKMIEVFENPNKPPYWGNLYNLTASVLYPNEYWPHAEVEGAFRSNHKRLYKQAKFFVLAKNYGAGRKKGDLLSKVKNSYDLVDNEFPLLAELQAKYLRDAERTGYVETIPSRAIDPTRGYPILAAQTEQGRVLSTTPFNYHVSGTACECKNLGMIRCAEQCAAWRAMGFDAWMCLEIHDELLFDFPRGSSHEENLSRALVLRSLMEQSGDDLIPPMPTPVSVEYHIRTWAEGVKI
jgi:Zn ribbon nucleic-acid-binding protein